MTKASAALRRIGLPPDLILLIKRGKLLEAIEQAQRDIDELNARLDLWEEQNPEAAALVPWAADRAAWKAAGRPRAEWYEALCMVCEHVNPPIGARAITKQLYSIDQNNSDKRLRAPILAAKRAAKAAKR